MDEIIGNSQCKMDPSKFVFEVVFCELATGAYEQLIFYGNDSQVAKH